MAYRITYLAPDGLYSNRYYHKSDAERKFKEIQKKKNYSILTEVLDENDNVLLSRKFGAECDWEKQLSNKIIMQRLYINKIDKDWHEHFTYNQQVGRFVKSEYQEFKRVCYTEEEANEVIRASVEELDEFDRAYNLDLERYPKKYIWIPVYANQAKE